MVIVPVVEAIGAQSEWIEKGTGVPLREGIGQKEQGKRQAQRRDVSFACSAKYVLNRRLLGVANWVILTPGEVDFCDTQMLRSSRGDLHQCHTRACCSADSEPCGRVAILYEKRKKEWCGFRLL